jgi:hypothetical protein
MAVQGGEVHVTKHFKADAGGAALPLPEAS